MRSTLQNILMEAITPITTVRGRDRGGAIAALFEGDIAVGGVVV